MPDKKNTIQHDFKFSPWVNRLGLIFSDIIAFSIVFVVSRIYIQALGEKNPDFLQWLNTTPGYARVWVFGLLVTLSILWFWGHLRHYTYRKPFWNELREVIITILALAVADLALAALAKWQLSRIYWSILWSLSFILVPCCRYGMKKLLLHLGCWQWPSVIIGCGENAKDAYLALQSEKMMGFDVIGFVTPDSHCTVSPIQNIPILNQNINLLVKQIPSIKFFIAVEYEQRDLLDECLRHLTQIGIRNVSVIPTLRGIPLYGTDVSHFFSHEVLMLRIRNNLARFSAQVLKRGFDILVSSWLVLLLSPVLAYICWKVSRDGGSPIYGHERVGLKGRKFKCLKFRSMIINSQEILQNLLATDPDARAEWEKDFKLKNDPRITPIGHFIRKTSLDELPQLWNVLKGEMSLVGPRPVVEAELERYGADVDYYFMTKPGMTGLWQVSGRNDTDYTTRVYLDTWYVKNWSLWYDIAIMFKTINVVLRRDGAY
jgi:Undecaprenyl-phosphate galactose phosphotransferase, WbaP/exopolysaccharide biosynthesis polyprenyl glycosylphosphotransferase